MESEFVNVEAASLVVDLTLYPRLQVDGTHVSRLAEAIRAGETLPPVLAEVTDHRVVDGVHRVKAALRAGGLGARISVQFREYADDAERFMAAVDANSRHGRGLCTVDRVHSLIRGQQLGLTDTQLSRVMGVTVERIGELRCTRVAIGPDGEDQAVKFGERHLGGTRLDNAQLIGMRRSVGMGQHYKVGQVLDLLEYNLLDWSDLGLLRKLDQLCALYAELSKLHRVAVEG